MINEYIKSDIYRYYGCFNLKTMMRAILSSTLRFQIVFRMCQMNGFWQKIGKVLWQLNITKKRIQIPVSTKIGYGLYIGHGGPVVVNGNAVIGNNCNLSQFVTIGANHSWGAVIGDNVYIDPNVCVVEAVCIGNNVTIGAGSVVTKNIPDNATAAGNYAKVLNYNNPGRYIGNPWRCGNNNI